MSKSGQSDGQLAPVQVAPPMKPIAVSIERMGDAHCVLDRELRILRVNAAAERLLGVPRAALLGRSYWEAFPASVDTPVGNVFRRVVAEGIEQHLTHRYTAEGYDLHLELDAYPTDEGGVAKQRRAARSSRAHLGSQLRVLATAPSGSAL